jgi:hypothetical protein
MSGSFWEWIHPPGVPFLRALATMQMEIAVQK